MSTPVPVVRFTLTDLGSADGSMNSVSHRSYEQFSRFGSRNLAAVTSEHDVSNGQRMLRVGPWCNGNTSPCDGRKCGFESRRVHVPRDAGSGVEKAGISSPTEK